MTEATSMSWTWFRAFEIAGSGLLTALVVTVCMVLIMRLTQVIVRRIDNNNNSSSIINNKAEEKNDKRVIAAVSAAINCYMSEDEDLKAKFNYTVSSSESRSTGKSKWRDAGMNRTVKNSLLLKQIRRNRSRENL